MTAQLVAAFLLGTALTAVFALVYLRSRSRDAQAIADLELSLVRNELATKDQSILRLEARNSEVVRLLDQEKQAFTDAQINGAALKSSLEARTAQVSELEARVAMMARVSEADRAELLSCREEISVLKTSLSEQQLQAEEKLTLLKDARESLQRDFKNLANEIFDSKQRDFKEQSKEQLVGILGPLNERIKAFEQRVEKTYNDESKERFSLIKEVRSLQDLNNRISQDAVNLTNALKGESKTQGAWGEVVLERVLEKSGLQKNREYEVQVALKNSEGRRMQPDVIIRLPEGKDVVVDAKVSLTAYERFCSSDVEAEKAQALKAHVQSLRQHIRQLGDKDYQNLEGIRTLDFVLLFIPIEAAFAVAVQEDSELFSDAFANNIMVVAPSTLLVTLRIIQNIWRYEQQNKNAQEIADRAGALYDKFVNFIADLDLIGSRLDSTQNAFQDAYNKLASGRGNLVKRAEDMKALGAKVSKSLPKNLVEMPQREKPKAVPAVAKEGPDR